MIRAILSLLCSLSLVFGVGIDDATTANAVGSIGNIEQITEEAEKQIFDLTVDENAKQGHIETRTDEEIQAELNRLVEEGMMTISINLRPVFADGQSNGHLRIENVPNNKYSQIVEIYRADTNEMVYRSGLIPIGNCVDYDRLLVDLDAGEYPCIAYVCSFDGSGSVVGKAGAELLLVIEN